MHRRYNLAHLILAGVVALVLTLLMVCVDAEGRIAFVSHRDGNPEIYVMDADGGNQLNLTNNPDKDWGPSWSPDGERIAFASNRDGHFLKFVPDHALEIYVMDADGGNPQNLTNNPSDDRFPSWSPDGKRIVFTSDRDGRGAVGITSEIYVMDADGQNEQRLTNNRGDDNFPSWSPDGKKILFDSNQDGKRDIYLMDADGGNLQNLTNNRHSDVSPAWYNPTFSVSPADKKITMWGWLKQVDR